MSKGVPPRRGEGFTAHRITVMVIVYGDGTEQEAREAIDGLYSRQGLSGDREAEIIAIDPWGEDFRTYPDPPRARLMPPLRRLLAGGAWILAGFLTGTLLYDLIRILMEGI